MRKNLKYVVSIVFLMILVISCATKMGHEFDVTRVNDLRKGMTESEVISTLGGKPYMYSNYPDGSYKASWLYTKAKVRIRPSSVDTRLLEILFDKDSELVRIFDQGDIKVD